ncbi:MAG: GNAT family N-acetyltransferase [Roseicyclus sp.]|uniref:GNAT family N-acetyltransferase n=1 Tax=Boseongicola sp. H5 TaxID=2763261 RepID=UPI001B2B8484|nr:GNAT family N-acetyltransferase [Boseongicola sp. H5]MBO6625456.1 GNAT family N-acetyltransferase [Roseicyclus sp.]MBO6923448.1 GNAT family N-acetyltransferase [Roseicyclus sp.]
MTLPRARDLYPVIEHTWPAARLFDLGLWRLREGRGSGSRTSAATLRDGEPTAADLAEAATAMRDMGQPPLFMIREGEAALDRLLETESYVLRDPVTLYAAPVDVIATDPPPPITCFEIWPPLAAQEEIWAQGGIGPERLAVMHRAATPKTTIFGRIDDRPAGTGFVALDGRIAMVHALETRAQHRRRGMGRYMMQAMAFWAKARGATHITLLVTGANLPANALYTSMGFQPVGHYHYRIKTETDEQA